ncbi:MAG: DUF4058 family protein [Caldilineaceae bacterium]
MASPFPGMDPYLEGYLWPDVHHRLATQISDQLMPYLRPRYVARIEVQMVTDETPEAEIGILYPDMEIVRTPNSSFQPSRGGVFVAEPLTASPVTATVPLAEFELRLATVEIRDTAQNQLVTSIEILSPINKREPGRAKYRDKVRRLYEANVNIIEIDLLRRGQRSFTYPRSPTSAYRISLTQAKAKSVDIWSIQLTDPLPVINVPLRSPDADVLLDLETAFTSIYDKAAYDLTIDYTTMPPPPALSQKEKDFVELLLRDHFS